MQSTRQSPKIQKIPTYQSVPSTSKTIPSSLRFLTVGLGGRPSGANRQAGDEVVDAILCAAQSSLRRIEKGSL